MSKLSRQVGMVVATIALFLAALALNAVLFSAFEFVPGINWIYLPAGVRLLCMLLFGEAGALGLLIVSWLVSFFYFFPDNFERAFMGGLLATAAPYLVYRLAQRLFGLQASLMNLTPARLFGCMVAYAVASPLLHHLWFFAHGERGHLLSGFAIMATGDFTGTLVVIYTLKLVLSFIPAERRQPGT